MARGKKESASLNLKIDKKIYEALDDFSDNSGQTKTFIVEKALKEYMLKYRQFKDMLKKD